MADPLLVIPLMGMSSRFAQVGVTVPKWSLRIGTRSMLTWAVESFVPALRSGVTLRFVLPSDQCDEFHAVSREWDWDHEVVVLDGRTRGQADSVRRALNQSDGHRPLWVFNCDSRILMDSGLLGELRGDCLVCTRLEGDHWSFARMDARGTVDEVAEKVRISEWSSTGLYCFDTCSTFQVAYQCTDFGANEEYVSVMYNSLIAVGKRIRGVIIEPDRFEVFGTPQELKAFCACKGLSSPIT